LVQYQDAIDYERRGDLTNARRGYYELITKTPSSPLVPYAYLAFGELFFAESDGDPSKLPLAQQAYEKVIQYPPPANRAYAYAWERHALVMMRQTDFARALSDAKKVIDATRNYSAPLADDVAASAKKTMIEAYARAGSPDRAYAFFRAVDAPSAPKMIVELGQEYLKRQLPKDLVAMYDDALANKDPEICRGALAAADALDATSGNALFASSLRKKHSATCGTP
jgi:tetratricopeptide (TPR) repeat protein